MHHFLLVHEGDSRHQLLDDDTGLLFGKGLPPLQPLQQLPALHELHDDVYVEMVGEDVHQLHDVGVALAKLQHLNLPRWVVSEGEGKDKIKKGMFYLRG